MQCALSIEGLGVLTPPGINQPEDQGASDKLTVLQTLSRYMPAKQLRHVDHFTRMALFCLFSAMEDAYVAQQELNNIGIILVSGHGPQVRTFEFLESILEYGPQMASPLLFSLSVHNIPAATLAIKLGLQCPCLTICQAEGAVAHGLATAEIWLSEQRAERVFLVAIEEQAAQMQQLTSLHLNDAPKGPLLNQPAADFVATTDEAAVCLCLSHNADKAKRGKIMNITIGSAAEPSAQKPWQDKCLPYTTCTQPIAQALHIATLGLSGSADLPRPNTGGIVTCLEHGPGDMVYSVSFALPETKYPGSHETGPLTGGLVL